MPPPKLKLWQIMWVHVNLWIIHEPKLIPNVLITFFFSLCNFICLWFQFEKLLLVPFWGTHTFILVGSKGTCFEFCILMFNWKFKELFLPYDLTNLGLCHPKSFNNFSIFTYSILVVLCFAIVSPNYWLDLWLLVL
jgi:hypothetical protein